VVHTHDLDALFASLVIKLLTGRKLVYDAHEHHASMIVENPKIPKRFKPWVERIILAAEEIACRFVDEVITVNRTLQGRYLRIGKRTTVLYNCPALCAYDRWSEKQPSVTYDGRSVVVYQGAVSIDRGVDQFLFALREVRKRCPEVMFLVAGPLLDEDQCGDWIARYVEEHDLAGHFRITGWLSYEEMGAYTRSAQVGVILFQPSHTNNLIGLPNKIFEYMASGKPVLASNFPEMRCVIEEGRCGLFVDPTDPEAIARAILYLLEHPQEAEEMGRRGRKLVEKKYNWEGMEKALEEVYRRLVIG
jgi:glycosyltransferase involved in cell wall biosynthesis